MNSYLKQIKFITIIYLILTGFLINGLIAQPRSRVTGHVKDSKTGELLVGVNVTIPELKIGAASDVNGKYIIINVPVGTYTVQATIIGYNRKIIKEVLVSADRVTNLNFDMLQTDVETKEVVVTAEKNDLHNEVSNTQLVVTSDQLTSAVGIIEINSFLQKQPGVSSSNGYLEIRGGSADQTGTIVNGLSFNNAANGNSETAIPLSAIEQISVLSGGFNAEYGNFRSGLINVTTKSGKKDRYHGTITMSQNIPHLKRFGPKMSDPLSYGQAPFLDASVAFIGTAEGWKNDPYKQQQHEIFTGWNKQAETYNTGKADKDKVTPLDLYLFAAWMQMAIPDYAGLAAQGYTVSDEQKKLFDDHAWKEEGTDYNIDAGFGGPIPFISEELGGATFYLSHNTKEQYYVMPVTRRSDISHTTLGTIKLIPINDFTLTLNGLWKKQTGVSPIRPAFGDFPDAGRDGGFMQIDNIKQFQKLNLSEGNYWYDAAMFPILDQYTLMGGVAVNHVLSKSTFYNLTLSYLSTQDHSPTGDNRDQTVITRFGPILVSEMPYGKWQFAPNNKLILIQGLDTIRYTHAGNDAVPGVAGRRYRGKEGDLYNNIHTQQYRARFDIESQLGSNNYLKAGFEYNRIDIDHNFYELWNNNAYNTYEYNYHRTPSQTGIYIQDQLSYEGIVANLGIRADYFYGGGGKWPSGNPFALSAFTPDYVDTSLFRILAEGGSLMWEKWEKYDQENPGFLQPVKNFFTISPRIGVSFPVTINSKFYFNYGHFRSNPPYYTMFLLRYRYTKNGLYNMSNPNLEPPKTISYELGMSYNFYDNLILTISGYYKDITGQQGNIEYVNSTGTIDYDSWGNNNYQDIQGLEINLSKNDNSWISGWINFNYMLKKSGFTGRRTITDITVNDDKAGLYSGNETRSLPQPDLNANITIRVPNDISGIDWLNYALKDWKFSIFGEWSAGSYFSWNPLAKDHISNNLQWPDYYMVDIRLSKTFSFLGFNSTVYCDIKNLFNIKVNLLSKLYAFNRLSGSTDMERYFASLRLPMYNSTEFDALRNTNPGLYIGGDDSIGELRSDDKPYINDPNYTYWIYGQPRDIWFGIKIDF